jgi:hypothetical protein
MHPSGVIIRLPSGERNVGAGLAPARLYPSGERNVGAGLAPARLYPSGERNVGAGLAHRRGLKEKRVGKKQDIARM